jgi:hypothetical protein
LSILPKRTNFLNGSTLQEEFSMSQEWDVQEFVERFRDGEFDGQLGETLDLLTAEQVEDLRRLAADAGPELN